MLPRIHDDAGVTRVTFCKYDADGRDVSQFGAFAKGERVCFTVTCPRELGVSCVVLRINRDGEAARDVAFTYADTELATLTDRYELTLDTAALCGSDESGLFYYRLLLVRCADTLFSGTPNNVDVTFSREGGEAFRLLVHEAGFAPPAWFGEGVMYHVFVDRFCRGEGQVDLQAGRGEGREAILNPDWAHGIPQYPPYSGAPLANNMFFGGNLWGVIEKLDYLESLGVKVIYLSPIFKAYSNHKYDTGDYLKVDPAFGGEAAFEALIEKAGERGMRVVLDGVFNHTGDDSLYFNRYGSYGREGALQSPESPYVDWFRFEQYPDQYDAWWGIPILPRLNPENDACRTFFTAAEGVCARYVKMGIGGWRLDVADELSDRFLDELRASVKGASDGDAVIIGEVWENAADKIAYGKRRRYFQGKQLDSVMNYPVRTGILAFVRDGDAETLYHTLVELYGSYPREVSDALMNLLGTHDTERILTVLGASPESFQRPNDELAYAKLSPEERETALSGLRMAATLQFTVFGIPSVYYGDEVGMEGYHDPFCRMPLPWHEMETPERADLLAYYRALGELRRSPAFHGGDFRVISHGDGYIVYERVARDGSDRVVIVACRGRAVELTLDVRGEIVLGKGSYSDGVLSVPADSVCVIR